MSQVQSLTSIKSLAGIPLIYAWEFGYQCNHVIRAQFTKSIIKAFKQNYAYYNEVTSQTTMSQVQFVTGMPVPVSVELLQCAPLNQGYQPNYHVTSTICDWYARPSFRRAALVCPFKRYLFTPAQNKIAIFFCLLRKYINIVKVAVLFVKTACIFIHVLKQISSKHNS